VRELRNVVERILLLSAGDTIDAATARLALPGGSGADLRVGPALAPLGQIHGSAPTAGMQSGALAQRVEEFERQVILAELERHHHHMTNTARALGLERSHLYKKCQHLGIDLRALRKPE
jgi:DNA-binding NtrC family response regulator